MVVEPLASLGTHLSLPVMRSLSALMRPINPVLARHTRGKEIHYRTPPPHPSMEPWATPVTATRS